jgi:hypothetical protein
MWDVLELWLLVQCPHHEREHLGGTHQARDYSPLPFRAGLEGVQARGRKTSSEGNSDRRFVLRYRRSGDALVHGAVVDDVLAPAASQFLENEFLKDDSVKFTSLAKGRSPVDSMGVATRGELARSPRYQDILAPMDLGDELRATLIVGSKCWGFMCLHRERSSPNLTPAEAAFLAKLAPHLAEGLRTALLIGDGRAASPTPDGPGLVLLGEDLSLAAITPSAEGWLAEVAKGDWSSSLELPDAVYAVAARLLALERDDPHASPNLMPRARLRTASGRWLVLHASRLRTAGTEGPIAFIFEEARPSEIAPLIVEAYGLTRREGEIT